MPPAIKVLLRENGFEPLDAIGCLSDSAKSAELLCGFILLSSKITGISTREPIMFLVALKVRGPTASPPSLCATKAIPQIVAVKRRISEFFNGIEQLFGTDAEVISHVFKHFNKVFLSIIILVLTINGIETVVKAVKYSRQ